MTVSPVYAIRRSIVKYKFSQREPVLIVAVDLHESMVELGSMIGFDAIWIDMEHPSTGIDRAASLIRAARGGSSDIVVRIPRGEFTLISRVLEAGAQGIIYPHCQGAEEAAEGVGWAKFPPEGVRPAFGLGPDGAFGLVSFPSYISSANGQVFVILLIEEPQGVENGRRYRKRARRRRSVLRPWRLRRLCWADQRRRRCSPGGGDASGRRRGARRRGSLGNRCLNPRGSPATSRRRRGVRPPRTGHHLDPTGNDRNSSYLPRARVRTRSLNTSGHHDAPAIRR
jgi:HpcH/HpaI aldolase/citrate lyase family